MKSKTRSLVFVGATAYLLAWFVPVVEGGKNLTTGVLPGWEAFRTALAPVWSYQGLESSAWYLRPDGYLNLLALVSGLTNFVLVGAVLRIILKSNQPSSWLRAVLFASGAFNMWFLLLSDRGNLQLGYYMWVIAYFLVAAGIPRSHVNNQGTPNAV